MTAPGNPPIPAELAAYLAGREQARAEELAYVFGRLSPREQRLVKEAAVMGYVQGTRAVPGGYGARIPPDSQVLALVAGACLAMPELYPGFARLARPRPQRRAQP